MTGDGEDMLTNGKKECPFTDEIVSYMYGELNSVECRSFETHLADCTACTDDFAAISNARFSVFEWRKEEFDQLATPRIVIPELAKSAVLVNENGGWFGALAGVLSLARSPLAVAAVVLVVLGVGFIALAYYGNSDALFASNTKVNVPAVKDDEPQDNRRLIETSAPEQTVEPDTIAVQSKRRLSYDGVPAATKSLVRTKPKRAESPRIAKKPVLNDFQDETDDSLRLTKLLDEIGG